MHLPPFQGHNLLLRIVEHKAHGREFLPQAWQGFGCKLKGRGLPSQGTVLGAEALAVCRTADRLEVVLVTLQTGQTELRFLFEARSRGASPSSIDNRKTYAGMPGTMLPSHGAAPIALLSSSHFRQHSTTDIAAGLHQLEPMRVAGEEAGAMTHRNVATHMMFHEFVGRALVLLVQGSCRFVHEGQIHLTFGWSKTVARFSRCRSPPERIFCKSTSSSIPNCLGRWSMFSLRNTSKIRGVLVSCLEGSRDKGRASGAWFAVATCPEACNGPQKRAFSASTGGQKVGRV